MTSGPSLILCLARDNAVEAWRELIGPKVCIVFDNFKYTSENMVQGY